MEIWDIEKIKSTYPNEWVLIGNPIMDESEFNVLAGSPILHSTDKQELCYLGSAKTDNYQEIIIIYTGTFAKKTATIGLLNKLSK